MKPTKLLFFLEIFSKGELLEKRLLRNHLLAVLVLISIVSISFLILTSIIKTQQDSSGMINSSGKQRMYTQKVLFYFSKYISEKKESSKEKLFENLEQLENNNKYLTSKFIDRDSIGFYDKRLIVLFNDKDGIKIKFREFKINIENFLSNKSNINIENIENQGEHLLNLYDESTYQFQKLAEDKVSQFLIFETTLFVISLITIFLEAVYIFRPAIFEVFTKHSELRKLNKNLSLEVEKQVAILREQERLLIQQSKMAEMGEMLSNISHQWKQPLTILSMQIEEIEMNLLNNNLNKIELKKSLENAFKQISLMSNTIEDFKKFYMPDNEKKEFNIYNTIKDIIQMEQSALQNYTISHKIKCNDNTLCIHGFESQLKQVLLSLTNNAIEQISEKIDENILNKYAGKIKYNIYNDEKLIIISVYDNAGGIPPSIIENIFNPYFTTKKDNGGSGIGLYMAKTIIEKNFNGKLYVKNAKKGAKFFLELPVSL